MKKDGVNPNTSEPTSQYYQNLGFLSDCFQPITDKVKNGVKHLRLV